MLLFGKTVDFDIHMLRLQQVLVIFLAIMSVVNFLDERLNDNDSFGAGSIVRDESLMVLLNILNNLVDAFNAIQVANQVVIRISHRWLHESLEGVQT